MIYLDSSWPFVKTNPSVGSNNLLTISAQGIAKVSMTDGSLLKSFNFNHSSNSITVTPESFGSCASSGFTSSIIAGGSVISSYTVPGNNSLSSSISPSYLTVASINCPVSVQDHHLTRLTRSLITNGRGNGSATNNLEIFNPALPTFIQSGNGQAPLNASPLLGAANFGGGRHASGNGMFIYTQASHSRMLQQQASVSLTKILSNVNEKY